MTQNQFRSIASGKNHFAAYVTVLWLFGLISGCCFSFSPNPTVHSMMRSLPDSAVSIVPFFCVMYFPLILSFLAIQLDFPALLFAFVFLKAFSFSLVSALFVRCFGSPGILQRYSGMFCSCGTVPILFYFWIKAFSVSRSRELLRFLICVLLITLIGTIYSCKMMPNPAFLLDF